MKIRRSTLILWQKRLVVFSCVSVVFFLLYIYFATHLFTITSYELIGVPETYKEMVTTRLREVASQKTYKIFPSNRVIVYPHDAIVDAVVETLPHSRKVTVIPAGLHTLRIKVFLYEPFLKIDETHAITKEGIIYTEPRDTSSLMTLMLASTTVQYVVEDDGIHSIRVEGVSETKLRNLVDLSSKINSVIFEVSKITIDGYGDISLHAKNSSSSILFSESSDIEKVWSNIVSAIDTDPLKSKLETGKERLEYLDTRFGNKVFYKFTNDTKTAIIQSYATTTASTTLSQ